MSDLVPVKRALISVSDKTGLADLARALASHGVEILSTGGSAKALTTQARRTTGPTATTPFFRPQHAPMQ